MKRTFLRPAMMALTALGLAACGPLTDGTMFDSAFWSQSPLNANSNEAEMGLAEMAKGNYVMAEAHFDKALRRNPQDVYALIGRGIIYQNTGQRTKARSMYEAVLALRPNDAQQMIVWANFTPRPVSEIASVNLSLLDSGGVVSGMDRGAAGGDLPMPPRPPVMPNMGAGSVTAQPMSQMSSGTMPQSMASQSQISTSGIMLDAGDLNVMSRFETLTALRDQNLITPEEYAVRRQANAGALLPLTSPPPAAGLDRPVPGTDQIVGRLRAIGRALEMRAITVAQHSTERTMIMDALLPDAPISVANPGRPPEGLMEAADRVRKLEVMRQKGLISSDEMNRERAAIEQALQPGGSMRTGSASAKAAPAAGRASSGGPQPGVHLASYRSAQAAEQGWKVLSRTHGDLLSGLQHDVAKVNLGSGKGTYYRLKAGPLASQDEAKSLCAEFKRKRQFCEPSFIGG